MEEKRTCNFRFQLFLFLLCRGNEKKKGKRSPKISRSSKKGLSIMGITKSITLEFGLNRMMEENTCG